MITKFSETITKKALTLFWTLMICISCFFLPYIPIKYLPYSLWFVPTQIFLISTLWFVTKQPVKFEFYQHKHTLFRLVTISFTLLVLTLILTHIVLYIYTFFKPVGDYSMLFNPIERQIAVGGYIFFANVLLFAPILEEILFRHFLPVFINKSFNKWIGYSLSSIIFSLLHSNVISLIPLFVFGLFLCWVYNKYNNILFCIIPHSLYNLYVLFSLF